MPSPAGTMDVFRYWIAVVLVISMPPAVGWWFLIHPLVRFWRRVGRRRSLVIVSLLSLAATAALFTVRDRLVGRDLGAHLGTAVVGAACLVGAARIGVRRRRQLTMGILAGGPELDAEDPGELLTGGVYAVVRHPRYWEVMLAVVGYALFAQYVGAYVVAALTAPLLQAIVVLEERELAQRFGAAYEEYRSRVPRWIPRRRPSPAPRAGG